MTRDAVARDMHLASIGARRQIEALARRAEVPLRSRVVRDEPLRALSIACAETGPWNVVALAEPFSGGAKRRPLHAVVTPLLIQARTRCARARSCL